MQILANKFIELSELLPENLESPQCESSSFMIEGGAIVPITKVSSKRKQEISDILTWVECVQATMGGQKKVAPSNYNTGIGIYDV